MNKFYSFSGLDGAGKSTQIELLKTFLEKNKGEKVEVLWSRGGYTPMFQFIKDLLKVSRGKTKNIENQQKTRNNQLRNPIIGRLWISIAIIDLILYYGLYFRWLRLRGSTLIADRYLEDTIIDFKLNFPNQNFQSWILWKLLKITAPSPYKSFLLLIPVEESIKRSIVKKEPFPDNPETLRLRLLAYQNIKDPNYTEIDCLQPVDKVHKKIVDAIQ